ncbi:MAG: hypothetical protein HC834_01035 [Rhodospirillales bacterium]|nr:hypothetical protein [Rhodospirillales bacterium]
MYALVDHIIIARSRDCDDVPRSAAAVLRDGTAPPVCCFLPWNTSLSIARCMGLLRFDFSACFELPSGLVSPVPATAAAAMTRFVARVETMLRATGIPDPAWTFVGYSLGTYPATVMANRFGARLLAIAPADRAALMIWESPAVSHVKLRAAAGGYDVGDYARAMGWHGSDRQPRAHRRRQYRHGRSRGPYHPASTVRRILDDPTIHVPHRAHRRTPRRSRLDPDGGRRTRPTGRAPRRRRPVRRQGTEAVVRAPDAP